MGRLNGVNHIAICTRDIKTQIEFFTDVLGLELVALYWMHGAEGAWHGFLKLNDHSYVAFVQTPEVAKIAPELASLDPRYTLHGAQEFVFERPVLAGDVLTSESGGIKTYEKQGKRGGVMKFVEAETLFVDDSRARLQRLDILTRGLRVHRDEHVDVSFARDIRVLAGADREPRR